MRTIAFGLLFVGFAGLAPVALAVQPRPGEAVVVIVAPWQSEFGAVEVSGRAGGDVLGVAPGGVAITRSSDPDFVQRLYRAGALLVLDAGIARGCVEPNSVQAFSAKGTQS